MAEPAAAEAVTSERDVLLATKLNVPGLRPDLAVAAPEAGLVDPLTSRELEALEMLAAGASNQAIARQLVVTLDTVKKHVSHVLSKLGLIRR